MKKSLVALALAGAFSGAVQAQSAIEMYGVVDMGFVRETGTVAGLLRGSPPTGPSPVVPMGNGLTSGVQSGTRLGFKGTEDLGGGLKGLFVLETGIAADRGGFNQVNTAFARQSFIGLQGNFGTVTLGRQYTPYFLTLSGIADPFAAGMAGAAQNLMLAPQSARPNQGVRMDNTVKYTSPLFSGASGELAYGFGEVPGSNSTGRVISASVTYKVKPLAVGIGYYRANSSPVAGDSTSSLLLAANWDFGVAKLHAGFANSEEFAGRDTRDFLIGATVPMGPHTFLVSYISKDDRSATNQDADLFALGYTYTLSKRTNLYASYGRISNDNGATFTVGNNSELGTGNKSFNVGVRHLF